jgi:hypothetical protein
MLHDVFTLKPGLLVETIDDESLVLDMERNVYFGLNPVALEVWRGLEAGLAPYAIVDGLTRAYPDIPEDALARDVLSFVEALVSQGLATRAAP